MFNDGRGAHRIEGIGDKMVTLIHNVLTTDYVMRLHDDHCVAGLALLERHAGALERLLQAPSGSLGALGGIFGVSGICNVLGAIRLARHLDFGPGENDVTIATDGFDRYPSVVADLADRRGPFGANDANRCFEGVFRGGAVEDILDVRGPAEKARLFGYKERVWSGFGYSHSYLESMQSQSLWDAEFAKIGSIDEALMRARKT